MDTHDLERAVYGFARTRGWWWLIPQLSYEGWSADFIAWGPKKGILEIEIKCSWADYKADGKKYGDRKFEWDREYPEISKHEWLRSDYPTSWRPTHFVFAAPEDLAMKITEDVDLPKGFGVWGVTEGKDNRTGEPHIRVEILKPMRRLMKLKPEQMGHFKQAAWKRALWFMDTWYWADNKDARTMIDEKLEEDQGISNN